MVRLGQACEYESKMIRDQPEIKAFTLRARTDTHDGLACEEHEISERARR